LGTLPISWHLPKWAGDPSYGMYVFAFPIQQCLIYFHLCGGSVPVLVVEAIVLSFAAGVISWHVLERPAVALGARISKAPKRIWAQRSRKASEARLDRLADRPETTVEPEMAHVSEVERER